MVPGTFTLKEKASDNLLSWRSAPTKNLIFCFFSFLILHFRFFFPAATSIKMSKKNYLAWLTLCARSFRFVSFRFVCHWSQTILIIWSIILCFDSDRLQTNGAAANDQKDFTPSGRFYSGKNGKEAERQKMLGRSCSWNHWYLGVDDSYDSIIFIAC